MKLCVIIISVTVFLIVAINVFVSMVTYISEDLHIIDQIKIYELFESYKYLKVRSKMLAENYTILIGKDETGVKHFIEHQSNLQMLEARPVVLKRYQTLSKDKEKLLRNVRITKFYLEIIFRMQRDVRTEIFFIDHHKDLPLEEIKFIQHNYPKDKIIIVTDQFIKLEKFKSILFPPVTEKEVIHVLKEYYSMKNHQILEVFQRKKYSIDRIFNFFKKEAKEEDQNVEAFIEVNQIEDLNQLSEKQGEALLKKNKEKPKQLNQEKKDTKQRRKMKEKVNKNQNL